MEIRYGDKTFQIDDECSIDAPEDRVLKQHLREHGIESLLNSKKLSQFSGCILDELLEEGAELVDIDTESEDQECSVPELEQDPVGSYEDTD